MDKKAKTMETSILENDSCKFDISRYIGYLYYYETTSYILKKRLIAINDLIKQVVSMREKDEESQEKLDFIKAHKRFIREMSIIDIGILVAIFLVISSVIAAIYALKTITVKKYAYISFSIIIALCAILAACMLINKKRSVRKNEKPVRYSGNDRLIDSLCVNMLKQEENDANDKLKLISNALKRGYDNKWSENLNGNYSGLVAISILYGYFDVGRCETIQEAIELFEQEKQNGTVFLDKEQIRKNLNTLNPTMYYTKLAVEACNSQLKNLFDNNIKMMDSVSHLYENELTESEIRKQFAIIKRETTNKPYYDRIAKAVSLSEM